MTDFLVVGVELFAVPIRGDGQTVIARVNAAYGDLLLQGVQIARCDDGAWRAWLPGAGRNHRVVLHPPARDALLHAALAALRALGAPAVPPLATAPELETPHVGSTHPGAPRRAPV